MHKRIDLFRIQTQWMYIPWVNNERCEKKKIEKNKKIAIKKRLRLTNYTKSKTMHILTCMNKENPKFATTSNKKYQQYQ